MSFIGQAPHGPAKELKRPQIPKPWPEEDVEIKKEGKGNGRKARGKGKEKLRIHEVFMTIADTYDLPTRASSSSHERGQATVTAASLSVDQLCGTVIRFAVYGHLAEHFQEQTENISV